MSFRSDLDQQRFSVVCDRKRQQDDWVHRQQEATRMSRQSSSARLLILVDEAYRQEKIHLVHQLEYCKGLLGNASPRRAASEGTPISPAKINCPCTRAFTATQLQPRYRALHLLMAEFPSRDVEGSFDVVRRSYRSDEEMLVDIIDRYGPEDPYNVNVRVWYANVQDRLASLSSRWTSIRKQVQSEMAVRDNSANVIRNLSVMRIFVEGSQADRFGGDSMDRSRRDAIHQAMLDELSSRNTLFFNA